MSNPYSTLAQISKRFDAEDLAFLAHNPYLLFTINTIDLFSHYVYKRVKRQNPDKTIQKMDDCIVIAEKSSHESLHLYPTWKTVGTNVQSDVYDDVNLAIERLDSKECKHIYLLFPKSEHFRKHISIKVPHLEEQGVEYTLKLVPYKIH